MPARAGATGAAGLAAQDLVAAAIGDAAELLDAYVDQVAGPVTLIAAEDLPGGPVQEREPVEAVAGQDAVHGRCGPGHLHHTGGLRHDQALPVSTTLVINTPRALPCDKSSATVPGATHRGIRGTRDFTCGL
jgi:hypothetical protein